MSCDSLYRPGWTGSPRDSPISPLSAEVVLSPGDNQDGHLHIYLIFVKLSLIRGIWFEIHIYSTFITESSLCVSNNQPPSPFPSLNKYDLKFVVSCLVL